MGTGWWLCRRLSSTVILLIIATTTLLHISKWQQSWMTVTTQYRHKTILSIAKRSGRDVEEVRHIVFLKIHKCGGSTMMNIMLRFGFSRNLKIMIPKKENVFSQIMPFSHDQILPYSQNDQYDMLTCHAVFNKSAIKDYFPADTKYIGIIRHPLEQFLSSFSYYGYLKYLRSIPGMNPIETFLEDPRKFEPKHPGTSFTNNRMSFDFGFPASKFGRVPLMREYVEQLTEEMDFVLVMEYFDESLLMLKRMLKWRLEDILYVPHKQAKHNQTYVASSQDQQRHREWAQLDYILYERFLGIFKEKLQKLKNDFYDELDTFRDIRSQVAEFCRNRDSNETKMVVDSNVWTESFTVSRKTCKLMLLPSWNFVRRIRDKILRRFYKRHKRGQ